METYSSKKEIYKMETICIMRDLYKAIHAFETDFESCYGISLNEALILCSLNEAQFMMSSKALAERTEMSTSQTSKVIGTTEDKGLIKRILGQEDKRMMYFNLTSDGKKILKRLKTEQLTIPKLIQPIFN